MALNPFISDAAAKAAADAVCALCNGGTIKIYTGAQPANANTAVGAQTLLVTLTFSATAFAPAAATGGAATANAITAANAVANGTAAWFRALKSDGTTVVFDGLVGTATADLILSTVALVTGGNVAVTSLTYTATE